MYTDDTLRLQIAFLQEWDIFIIHSWFQSDMVLIQERPLIKDAPDETPHPGIIILHIIIKSCLINHMGICQLGIIYRGYLIVIQPHEISNHHVCRSVQRLLQQESETVIHQQVVGIHEQHVFTLSHLHACIPADGRTDMILLDDLDVMIVKLDVFNDFHTVVRRAIVHDNDLKVLVRQSLAIDTFQA